MPTVSPTANSSSAAPRAWTTVTSHAVVIARNDIDTDQIIPARFLTTTSRTGLGAHCFADWRYDATGAPRADFPLNAPTALNAQILVAGHNFGCGSSREHAPWSLADVGFRAVVAGSFADIFRSNAHKTGLLTVAIGDEIHNLQQELLNHPSTRIHIDLAEQTVQWNGVARAFAIDQHAKQTLLSGTDELLQLVARLPHIQAWERQRERAS